MKKTKIICTVGPSSDSYETLSSMVDAWMNVMRLNFSHWNHDEQKAKIKLIEKIMKEKNKYIPIILDTKWPEIRTGLLKDSHIYLEQWDSIVLTTNKIKGDENKISISYDGCPQDVNKWDSILIDDWLVELEVLSTSDDEIECKVINSWKIWSRKWVNLPGIDVTMPALTKKDRKDIKFGCEMNVDYIAASFIRKASDVKQIRNFLDQNDGEDIKIISKIENQEWLDNFREIIDVSDSIMIARGDLGVEIPIQKLPMAQKMMIQECNQKGKTVITATHMLDSMIYNPRPTRAEVTDVANAIIDGTDAFMLSGETAVGKYPIKSVETMAKIALDIDPQIQPIDYYDISEEDYTKSIAKWVVESAQTLDAKLIVVASASGRTVRLIRSHFPKQPILCLTSNEKTARQVQLVRWVDSKLLEDVWSYEDYYDKAKNIALDMWLVEKWDTILITAWWTVWKIWTTDMLKIDRV